jgi:hypothetical protein
VKGSRHIEILGYLPNGTRVPKAISSVDCDSHHTRTIGLRGRFRKTCGVSLSANGGVNLKQEFPGRDLFYET